MAGNRIQFQKRLSEAGFATLYGTEDRCRAVVAIWPMAERVRLPCVRWN